LLLLGIGGILMLWAMGTNSGFSLVANTFFTNTEQYIIATAILLVFALGALAFLRGAKGVVLFFLSTVVLLEVLFRGIALNLLLVFHPIGIVNTIRVFFNLL